MNEQLSRSCAREYHALQRRLQHYRSCGVFSGISEYVCVFSSSPWHETFPLPFPLMWKCYKTVHVYICVCVYYIYYVRVYIQTHTYISPTEPNKIFRRQIHAFLHFKNKIPKNACPYLISFSCAARLSQLKQIKQRFVLELLPAGFKDRKHLSSS